MTNCMFTIGGPYENKLKLVSANKKKIMHFKVK